MKPEPFLKWPGGKRWLVQSYSEFLPANMRRYVEPFLGGGAVYFHLMPRVALLSDSNRELINAYRCLRTNPTIIDRRLRRLHAAHSKETYYSIREANPTDPIDQAIRFLYLNRTCFNGIYRVNRRGHFNVPMGSKTLVEYPRGFLAAISNVLRTATIRVADFEQTIAHVGRGDFLFVDPPYTVMHNNNNFVKYNANLFSWSDQVRLSAAISEASQRGARIMICNADHSSLRKLYDGFGYHHCVSRSSVLAASAAKRSRTTELLITNYRTKF